MRTNDILLNTFEEIKILYQYLYMSPEHTVKVNNGLCDLVICMTDNLRFKATNLNFPDHPPLDYTENMSIPNMEGIIDYLKQVPAIEFPESFSSRWEEIEMITKTNVVQNKIEYEKWSRRYKSDL